MITPRKALLLVVLVLLLCGLLNARWTRWLTRPIINVVETVHYPSSWMASNLGTNPPMGVSFESEGSEEEQAGYLKALVEKERAINKGLWLENEKLKEQINAFNAIIDSRDVSSIRMVEARVSQYNAGPSNPTMKLLRGSMHGLRRDDAVVYHADLLGFVTDEIGPSNALVSLITRKGFEIQVHIMPPNEEDAGAGWPLVDRVASDGKGAFTCDLRIKVAEALRPGDLVRVADDLRDSANGFVLGVVDRIEKHPTNPTQESRVFIKPRTPIGPQRRVTVLTSQTD